MKEKAVYIHWNEILRIANVKTPKVQGILRKPGGPEQSGLKRE